MPSALEEVKEAVIAQSLQDARALSVRAQDSAAKAHDVVWTDHLAYREALRQQSLANAGVEASYRGSHLKMGAEVDAQQAIAEGSAYKGESLASYPQTQGQHSAQLLDLEAKIAGLADLVSKLVKGMTRTPPKDD